MVGWADGAPDPLGTITPTVPSWAGWVCCGLSRAEFFSFSVLLPRPGAMAQWVPEVFLATPRGKELTANQGGSKLPEEEPFPHIAST